MKFQDESRLLSNKSWKGGYQIEATSFWELLKNWFIEKIFEYYILLWLLFDIVKYFWKLFLFINLRFLKFRTWGKVIWSAPYSDSRIENYVIKNKIMKIPHRNSCLKTTISLFPATVTATRLRRLKYQSHIFCF